MFLVGYGRAPRCVRPRLPAGDPLWITRLEVTALCARVENAQVRTSTYMPLPLPPPTPTLTQNVAS